MRACVQPTLVQGRVCRRDNQQTAKVEGVEGCHTVGSLGHAVHDLPGQRTAPHPDRCKAGWSRALRPKAFGSAEPAGRVGAGVRRGTLWRWSPDGRLKGSSRIAASARRLVVCFSTARVLGVFVVCATCCFFIFFFHDVFAVKTITGPFGLLHHFSSL